MLKETLLDLRDIGRKTGCEIVFLAQDRKNTSGDEGENEDDDGNQIDPDIGPMLMPSVCKKLNASVSVIANTYIKSQERKITVGTKRKRITKPVFTMRLGPNSSYVTKIRNPKSTIAPTWLEDPTYKDVLEIIRGD